MTARPAVDSKSVGSVIPAGCGRSRHPHRERLAPSSRMDRWRVGEAMRTASMPALTGHPSWLPGSGLRGSSVRDGSVCYHRTSGDSVTPERILAIN